jgi:hypothetical protein
MFDDLDDPSGLPAPGDDARAHVARRARVIKRNRNAGLAGGLASVVLLVVAVAAGVRGAADPAGLDPVTTGTPVAQESPTPSGSPTATPSSAASSAPPPSVQPTRPLVIPEDPQGGLVGLGTGEGTRCVTVDALPATGAGPAPGLTMTAAFPEPGRDRGVLTITNTSSDLHADFDIRPIDSGAGLQSVAVGERGARSGYLVTDSPEPRDVRVPAYHVRLAPGESWSEEFAVRRSACASPPEGESGRDGTTWWRRLPERDYQMAVGVEWWGYTWRAAATASPGPAETGTPSPEPSPSGEAPERPADVTYAEGRWGTAPQTVRIESRG